MGNPANGLHHDLREVNETIRAKVRARAKARQLVDRLGQRLGSLKKRRRKLRKAVKQLDHAKPDVVIERSVANQSSRDGAKPRLLVLHSTEGDNQEGTADLAAVVSWFDNPAAEASSHVITDADGHSARCVGDDRKAWHVSTFNAVALGVEQIGHASQSDWDDDELRETARWLAQWSREHGIPLVRGAVSGSAVTRAGVVTHSQLGAAGGGHSDPGSGYPVDRVIEIAKSYR